MTGVHTVLTVQFSLQYMQHTVTWLALNAGLGALYGPLIPHMLMGFVHHMVMNALKDTTNLKSLHSWQ